MVWNYIVYATPPQEKDRKAIIARYRKCKHPRCVYLRAAQICVHKQPKPYTQGGFYTSRKVVPWPPAVLNIGKHCRGLLSRDSRTNYTPVRALITRAARACTPLPRELFRLGAGSPPARARNNSLRLPLRLLASRFAPSRFDEYTALVVVFHRLWRERLISRIFSNGNICASAVLVCYAWKKFSQRSDNCAQFFLESRVVYYNRRKIIWLFFLE